jgi:L-fuculose-phosphate aldolase
VLLRQEREQIVEYGKRMLSSGLTRGTGGNISIYNPAANLMAISPSGLAYAEIRPEDVVVLDLDGGVADGLRKPSTELDMHKIFYLNRNDIRAIVHTHSPFATTISALNWELPAVSYLVAFAGQDVRCAPYATPGSMELAENVYEAMRDRRAALLANHGFLAGADSLANAFNIAEEIEFCAEIYYRSKSMGEPVILPAAEVERLIEKFKSYGQK